MDSKTLKLIAENMEEFSNHAYDIATTFIELNGKRNNYINELDYYSDIIDISYDASSRGCCSDTESIKMPIEYLWEDGWKEKAQVYIASEKKKSERAEALKKICDEEERTKAKEKKDKEDYERLKDKFEGKKS